MASVEEIVRENDEKFNTAWDMYWHQETTEKGQKKQWDIMFNCVYFCCCNLGKTKAYGLKVPDLESKCLDAAIKVMSVIKEGRRPSLGLGAFCYLYVIGELWKHKTIEWERSLSYNGLFDNYGTDSIDGQYVLAEEAPLNNNGYILDESDIVSKDNIWYSDQLIMNDIAYVNEDDGTYNICSSEY